MKARSVCLRVVVVGLLRLRVGLGVNGDVLLLLNVAEVIHMELFKARGRTEILDVLMFDLKFRLSVLDEEVHLLSFF
jgi:hypothetical protein